MELVEISSANKSNWKELNLGESAILKARIGWQGLTTAEYLETGNYYLITGTDFKSGFIDWDNCVFVEKNRFDQDRNIQVQVGDVLVTKDGTIGKVAFVDKVPKPTTLNSGVFVIRPKNKSFDTKYFYYVLMSNHFEDFLSRLTAGSTISHLYQKDFVNFNFSLPPLPEQKAIAQVLSDTDNLIQAIEQKLDKKRAIKQGAMQQLLTPKEDWEIKKLGDIARYRRGSFPQPYGLPQWYDENNGTPFVQVFDVDKNMRLKSTTKQKISDLAKDKSVFVQKGNVVITLQGSIGRIAITQYDAYVDRTLLIFTDYKVPMDKVFFAFVIQEKFRIEKENAPGGIIKTITKEELSKFDIPLPKTKDEQTEIATILSDMDAEIAQLEQKLIKYKMLKQGLMQNLLTGKIRLV
jgi:type I restriction enzyme S subunit